MLLINDVVSLENGCLIKNFVSPVSSKIIIEITNHFLVKNHPYLGSTLAQNKKKKKGMNITIYFKANAPLENISYRIDIEEFRRLSADFQNFLENGDPKDGLYQVYSTRSGDSALQSKRAVHFNFAEISIIG